MRVSRWFLGVDGGGTKTAAAIVDDRGRLRALAVGPPSLPTVHGWKAAMEAIRATVAAVERRGRLRAPSYAGACFALAGVDSVADARTGTARFTRSFPKRFGSIRVVNDTLAALRAGTGALYAAVVVAGTGSNCYARGPRGAFTAGGFGWILGDDGSGFWIGRRGLRAAVRQLDGRGPATALTPALLRNFRTHGIAGIHRHLTGTPFLKRTVSQASIIVDRVARRADPVARDILREAGERLARMAITAAKRSGLARHRFLLVLSGGVFRAPLVVAVVRTVLRRALPQAVPTVLRTAPAIGAARIAWQDAPPTR